MAKRLRYDPSFSVRKVLGTTATPTAIHRHETISPLERAGWPYILVTNHCCDVSLRAHVAVGPVGPAYFLPSGWPCILVTNHCCDVSLRAHVAVVPVGPQMQMMIAMKKPARTLGFIVIMTAAASTTCRVWRTNTIRCSWTRRNSCKACRRTSKKP